MHIFYVKSQQSSAEDIVGNMRNQASFSPHFYEFLHTLGWAVEIGKHPGKIFQLIPILYFLFSYNAVTFIEDDLNMY